MDITFFNDPEQIPKPAEEIRIESVSIVPLQDGFRVKVELDVTPFLQRPNLLLAIHDEQDRVVSELSIIETMHTHMEFTMHLRGVESPYGVYTLTAELFYETRNPPQDEFVEGFVVAAPDETPDTP